MVLLPGCGCCQSDACFGDWVDISTVPDSIELDIAISNPSQQPQLTAQMQAVEQVRGSSQAPPYVTDWSQYSTAIATLFGTASGPNVSRQTISIPVAQELLQFGVAVYNHSFLAPNYYVEGNLQASGGSLSMAMNIWHAGLSTASSREKTYYEVDVPGFTPQPNETSSGPSSGTLVNSLFSMQCSTQSGIVSGGWSAQTSFQRAVRGALGMSWESFGYPRQCGGNPVGMRDYSVTIDAQSLFPVVIATRPAIYVSRFASSDWYEPEWYLRTRTNLYGSVQPGGFTQLASPVGIGGATDGAWYAIQSTVTIYGITLIRGTTATPIDGSRFLSLLPGHPAASCVPDWLSYS